MAESAAPAIAFQKLDRISGKTSAELQAQPSGGCSGDGATGELA